MNNAQIIKRRNKARALRAHEALSYYEVEVEGYSAAVDLRHLCDREGWTFGDLDSMAYDHYLAEIDPELEGETRQ